MTLVAVRPDFTLRHLKTESSFSTQLCVMANKYACISVNVGPRHHMFIPKSSVTIVVASRTGPEQLCLGNSAHLAYHMLSSCQASSMI